MKNLFKKFFVVLAILASTTVVFASPTYAEDAPGYLTNGDTSNCRQFLGMPSWDCHLPDAWDQSNLQSNIWIIASNIASAITKLAAYLTIGFVIYGGYLYIFASGDPGKAASGKKTLTRAFIGLAIVAFANIIVSSAGIALLGNSGAFDKTNCVSSQCISETDLVNNAIGWFIGIAGVVCAIFIVVGGIGYITSAGDPSKLQKAKATLYYALIGLVIVGLANAITNFVISAINASNTGTSISGPITSLLNTVIGIAGLVAVIYLIKGGVGYMTSTGDAGKIKKAKDTILYACIGLIIVALAFAIVNWAIGTIDTSDQPEQTSLLKNDIAFLDKTL